MNNNLNNNYSFDSITGQLVNGQSIQNQNIANMYSQQPVEPQQPKKKKKKNLKVLIIIAVAVVVIILGIIFVPKLFIDNPGKSNEPIVVSSTFETKDDHYVLKGDNGKILLDNIKSHGKFCNGTTEVKNTDGEYGIIDGSGKFIADYGKYSYINQYSSWGGNYYCFYEVRDDSKSQEYILKYDGSIFYSNDDDKYLRDVDMEVYDSTTKFILFETEDNFQFVSYLGNVFFTIAKVAEEEPDIMSSKGENVYDKYLTIYYNNKTYIYDLNSFKQKYTFDGKYSIGDLHVSKITTTIAGIESNKEEESLIIWGYPDVNNTQKRNTYLYHKDKLTFETDKCLNVAFVDGNDLRCLVKNGGIFEYYDINGNKLEK